MGAAQERLRCVALRRDGQPCQSFASTPDGYCVMHGPRAAEVHALGGLATSASARAAKALPSRLRTIADGLERAFANVEHTDFDTKRANSMATLASAIVKVFQADEYEQRLRELERRADEEGRFKDARGRRSGGVITWPADD